MGKDRFCYISSALDPEQRELKILRGLLSKASTSKIKQIFQFSSVIDAVIDYYPGQKQFEAAEADGGFLPYLRIRRKPHNGMLLYLSFTTLQVVDTTRHLPFFVGLFPHLNPKAKPFLSWYKMLQQTCKIIISTDAWFDAKKNFDAIPVDHTYTLSLNEARWKNILPYLNLIIG
jgi:hypothetical protein